MMWMIFSTHPWCKSDYYRNNFDKTALSLTSEHVLNRRQKSVSQKDWIALFNDAVFSLISTDTITSNTAQPIILMALHGIGHLFGIGGILHKYRHAA